MTVEKFSVTVQASFNIRECILERNHTNSMNVGMPLVIVLSIQHERTHTGEKPYECGKDLVTTQLLLNIKELTLGRSSMNVRECG